MAFETLLMSYEECKKTRDKYKLSGFPFCIYRFDKQYNAYVYLTFGADSEHPGQFYFIWDDQVCWIEAYPTQHGDVLNDEPEKIFYAHLIIVPKDFNKDRELFVQLIKQAFTNFEGIFKDKLYNFKVICNWEKALQNIQSI